MEAMEGYDMTQDEHMAIMHKITELQFEEDAFNKDHADEIKKLKESIDYEEEEGE